LPRLAAADQIVIATSTRRLVGNAFELTDLGEHDLKGIAEPVSRLAGGTCLGNGKPLRCQSRRWSLTPLVGRDEELDPLLRRWCCPP
jgi:hypothetical protein